MHGFVNIDFVYILTHIIIPLMFELMDMICIPYFTARFIGLFIDSYVVQSLLVRFSFVTYLLLKLLWIGTVYLYAHLVKLHNEIRDSRYLLDMELQNK